MMTNKKCEQLNLSLMLSCTYESHPKELIRLRILGSGLEQISLVREY